MICERKSQIQLCINMKPNAKQYTHFPNVYYRLQWPNYSIARTYSFGNLLVYGPPPEIEYEKNISVSISNSFSWVIRAAAQWIERSTHLMCAPYWELFFYSSLVPSFVLFCFVSQANGNLSFRWRWKAILWDVNKFQQYYWVFFPSKAKHETKKKKTTES